MKPDKRLKRKYDKWNKAYFDGALPGDTKIILSEEIDKYALTVGIEEEESKHIFFHIYINPRFHYDGRQIDGSLIHEMAHVKLYPWMKHGKKFEEEMKRLAMRDAFRGIW